MELIAGRPLFPHQVSAGTPTPEFLSDDASAYFNRAYEYHELGQYQFAIEDLDEAIRLDSGYAVAYHNRGVAYQSLGMSKEAERSFQKAKELGYAP